jgi:peptide/nickel transport system permease protein
MLLDPPVAPRVTPRRARLLRQPTFLVGLLITAPVVLITVLGPIFAPKSPTEFVAPAFTGAGGGAWFGTDNLGRDVWSRFLHGGVTLLLLGALSTVIGVLVGGLLGVAAAYTRGIGDELTSRVADVLLAFPPIVLALLFVSILGPRTWLLMAVVALGHLPRSFRVLRGAAMGVVGRDFVSYAESLGYPRRTIVLRELAPNLRTPLMVELGIRFTYSLGLIAGLSFLGLGVQPPTADWGLMINENRIGLTVQPWGVLLPLLAIALLTVGSNLMTDGVSRHGGQRPEATG